jgi:hypothetical protein
MPTAGWRQRTILTFARMGLPCPVRDGAPTQRLGSRTFPEVFDTTFFEKVFSRELDLCKFESLGFKE